MAFDLDIGHQLRQQMAKKGQKPPAPRLPGTAVNPAKPNLGHSVAPANVQQQMIQAYLAQDPHRKQDMAAAIQQYFKDPSLFKEALGYWPKPTNPNQMLEGEIMQKLKPTIAAGEQGGKSKTAVEQDLTKALKQRASAQKAKSKVAGADQSLLRQAGLAQAPGGTTTPTKTGGQTGLSNDQVTTLSMAGMSEHDYQSFMGQVYRAQNDAYIEAYQYAQQIQQYGSQLSPSDQQLAQDHLADLKSYADNMLQTGDTQFWDNVTNALKASKSLQTWENSNTGGAASGLSGFTATALGQGATTTTKPGG